MMHTAEEVLYLDRLPQGKNVMLKIVRVIIRNGEQALESYALLDDGSERTILIQSAETLRVRMVRDIQVLNGATVSFDVSPALEPDQVYRISNAFTARELGLAEHTQLIDRLKDKYLHLRGLPLQDMKQVKPVLLVGSDHAHLITPVEPVR